MFALNLKKVVASAVAALMLTVAMSWTFVDSTRVVHGTRAAGNHGFVAAISALVR
jgi:hypothetical protein